MAERRDPDAAGFCGDTGCQRDRAQGSNPHDHAVSQRAVSKSLTAMTYELTIEPLGASVPIEEGQTILDAALRAGIYLPHACGNGLCATCKVHVANGKVDQGDRSEEKTYELQSLMRT